MRADRRAEILLANALARAHPGNRNVTCFVMARYLPRVGLTLAKARRFGAEFARRVPQTRRDPFTAAEVDKALRSGYGTDRRGSDRASAATARGFSKDAALARGSYRAA